jgi:hypothetical protein
MPDDLARLAAHAEQELRRFAEDDLELRLDEVPVRDALGCVVEEPTRSAWLLYWHRFMGHTLADRFLADPDRGDRWVRRWLEAASGTPPDVLRVLEGGRGSATLGSVSLEGGTVTVQLARGERLEAGELVLGAPVRVGGRRLLVGGWGAGPSSKARALEGLPGPIERLVDPAAVLRAFAEVAGA